MRFAASLRVVATGFRGLQLQSGQLRSDYPFYSRSKDEPTPRRLFIVQALVPKERPNLFKEAVMKNSLRSSVVVSLALTFMGSAGSVVAAVAKPWGVFSDAVDLNNPDPELGTSSPARGTLLRFNWSDIEPAQGQFTTGGTQKFKAIHDALSAIATYTAPPYNKGYSLAIKGGPNAPQWLKNIVCSGSTK